MTTVTYKIKKLIDGQVIFKEGLYVAVPDRGHKGHRIRVEYGERYMTIKNWHTAEAFRRFHDLHGLAHDYLLGYFKWNPEGYVDRPKEYEFKDGKAYEKTAQL